MVRFPATRSQKHYEKFKYQINEALLHGPFPLPNGRCAILAKGRINLMPYTQIQKPLSLKKIKVEIMEKKYAVYTICWLV
jgi:hypothetical protein